jgi:tetratricopeptide (TPR) repeat protein
MKNLLLFLFVTASSLSLRAQPGMYSEADIAEQTTFIDAIMYKLEGNHEKQIEAIDKLLKNEPTNDALYYERAGAFLQLKKNDAAYQDIKKAIKFSDANKNYYLLKADIEDASKNYKGSVASLNKLINLDPSHLEHYFRLADVEEKSGNFKEAIAALNKAEQVAGIQEPISSRKAMIFTSSGDESSAIMELEKLADGAPYNKGHKLRLASYLESINKPELAKPVYTEILQLDPDDPTANLALVEQGDSGKDGTSYFKAIMPLIENENIPIDAKLIELIAFVEDMPADPSDPYNLALEDIMESLRNLYPQDAKVYAISGDFYFNTIRQKKAINYYKKTIDLNDKVYAVWSSLMHSLYFESEYKQLANYAEQVIDLYPNSVESYYFYALASLYLKQNESLASLTEEAYLIAGGNNSSVELLNSLELHESFCKGNYNAIKIVENSSPITTKLMGDIFDAKGQKAEAINYWKKAIAQGYFSESLQKKIEASKS